MIDTARCWNGIINKGVLLLLQSKKGRRRKNELQDGRATANDLTPGESKTKRGIRCEGYGMIELKRRRCEGRVRVCVASGGERGC